MDCKMSCCRGQKRPRMGLQDQTRTNLTRYGTSTSTDGSGVEAQASNYCWCISKRSIGKASDHCCWPTIKRSEPEVERREIVPQSKPEVDKAKRPEKKREACEGKIEIGQVSININELVESMNVELESLQPLSEWCCIYRVPAQLRELNPMAYTPRAVSIGPFHHGNKELKAMEDDKRRYFGDFHKRVSENGSKESMNKKMEELFQLTGTWERRLRDSYAEKIDIDGKEFVKMVLVDATFIIEYLLKRHEKKWNETDRIFNKQRMTNIIRFDILLIENQVPYFFLKELLSLVKNDQGKTISMNELVSCFLRDSIGWHWLVEDDKDVQHLVHFLKLGLKLSNSNSATEDVVTYEGQVPPSISQLHRAGVKFKSISDGLLDIKFNARILEIPKWKINDHTEILFRNIQAFEQCHYSDNSVSNYIAIMDFLVNTPEDVEQLVKDRIIDNWLKDNQTAADLINSLGTHNLIPHDTFYFSDLIKKLDDYYKNPWYNWKATRYNWKATLKEKYFNNPWSIISVIAAAFLLLLAFIQTVFTIYPLKR